MSERGAVKLSELSFSWTGLAFFILLHHSFIYLDGLKKQNYQDDIFSKYLSFTNTDLENSSFNFTKSYWLYFVPG